MDAASDDQPGAFEHRDAVSDLRNASEKPVHHPLRAAEHEVEHLRAVADKGESAATPAIIVGAEFVFLVPLVLAVIALALGIAYLVAK